MILRALPGLSWRRERPDILLVWLPNGNLHLRGVDMASIAEYALETVSVAACTRDAAAAEIQARAGANHALVNYVIELLLGARCLRELATADAPSEMDWLFWARSGHAFDAKQRPLVTCLAYDRDARALEEGLRNVGCDVSVCVIEPDMPAPEAADVLFTQAADVFACFGAPINQPFTRALNRRATHAARPVLFGDVSGFVGRIGPTIFGRNMPCLECVRKRHAANGGEPLPLDDLDFETARAPPPPLAHPAVRALGLSVLTLEVSRFAAGETPQTFGSYLEVSWTTEVVPRTIHKIPGCSGCGHVCVERYPFDVAPLIRERF